MYRLLAFAAAVCCSIGGLPAQELDEGSLEGSYGLLYLAIRVNESGSARGASSLVGEIEFDGRSRYVVRGRRGDDAGELLPFEHVGSYALLANGFVDLTDPLGGGDTVNARLGAGSGTVAGATTESDGARSFFLAVRSPSAADASLLQGRYAGTLVRFPGGRDDAISASLASFEADGQGGLPAFHLEGHARDQDGVPIEETLGPGTYAVGPAGDGELHLASGGTLLGDRLGFRLSADGGLLAGWSEGGGVRDIFVAARLSSEPIEESLLSGTYWILDFLTDLDSSAYTGAVGALRPNGAGAAYVAQRQNFVGPVDYSGVWSYHVAEDSYGALGSALAPGLRNFALGAGGEFLIAATVDRTVARFERYGVTFGMRLPVFEDSGETSVSPAGIVNAASFAPLTNPVAPGSLLSLFGSGLASSAVHAESLPLPAELGGVSVSIGGAAAPLLYVSPEQINLQAPYELTGAIAEVVLSRDGQVAARSTVPVAPTSPGVFSVAQNGIGAAVVTDILGRLITEERPAAPGQPITIWLTGMGAVDPPVGTGQAAPSSHQTITTDASTTVFFGREVGRVLFSGLAPGFAGLYQINVEVPQGVETGPSAPLAISTVNAFSDFVDIAIGL